jgi:hypothetical protein
MADIDKLGNVRSDLLERFRAAVEHNLQNQQLLNLLCGCEAVR